MPKKSDASNVVRDSVLKIPCSPWALLSYKAIKALACKSIDSIHSLGPKDS